MHVEKNVFDNMANTLLNIIRKTKDTKEAHLNLVNMKIRNELHLLLKENKLLKPYACCTLTLMREESFVSFLT